jgi:hypothetical protein
MLMTTGITFAVSVMFILCPPLCVTCSCDEITFRQPVDVGALLRLRSDVVHTVPEQVRVVGQSTGVGEEVRAGVPHYLLS